MDRKKVFLTIIENKMFFFLAAEVKEVEIEEGKPPVKRIGIANGKLTELLNLVNEDVDWACDFIERLEGAGLIKRVSTNYNNKRLPVLEAITDFSTIEIVVVEKPQEDIMAESKKEISLEELQSRLDVLRKEAHSGDEEIVALGREISAKIMAGEAIDQNLVNRRNALIAQPKKSTDALATIQRLVNAYTLVIFDLVGEKAVEPLPPEQIEKREKKKPAGKKRGKTSKLHPEYKLVISWFSHVKDPQEWAPSRQVVEAAIKDKTFVTVSHVRMILCSSTNLAEGCIGLFEARAITDDERIKHGNRPRCLYRISQAGMKFVQEYTEKK